MAEQQKEALGRILDHSINEFYILDINTFQFQYVNKAAITRLGYTREELLRFTPIDITPKFSKKSFPLLIAPLIAQEVQEINLRATHFRKDCTTYPVKIQLHLSDYMSKQVIVANVTDITEEQNSATEIIESKRFIESIADTSPELLYVFDFAKGDYIYFSNHIKDMLGYEVDDVLNGKEKLFTKLHPEDFQKVAYNFQEKIRQVGDDEVVETEYRVQHRDGHWVWLSSRDKPFKRDENGHVTQTVGTAQDITHRIQYEQRLKRQNEELKKTNAELDRFVYSSSHDLRAPLASVLGLINIALLENTPEEKDVYIKLMETSINRLDRFIQDIINYSRNSRMEVAREAIDFEKLVDDTISNLNYMEGLDVINFTTSYDVSVPFVSDERRLSVILSNLIGNAIRYRSSSVDQPYIHIKVSTSPEFATIVVEDNGIGIAPEHQTKIFDMFFKASNERHGSGIGLYIVKETISVLKGSIAVESKTRVGTIFTLRIPNLA
ncbi:PAS domain S-box-containing protein [Catalinimonas alkaloidigena]|uniref:PAS domain-containing sensor histidine kinase n=1 Tax=Catalinimonas alkaloidigena TaxID=1075417 RepID=UPI002406118B|nr:PAS domain S-box protein [Catalinimonas alkaloidigena]MDF9800012.1 PAS domain S-box-containing protein [Catalinimonas alkaloidigena]